MQWDVVQAFVPDHQSIQLWSSTIRLCIEAVVNLQVTLYYCSHCQLFFASLTRTAIKPMPASLSDSNTLTASTSNTAPHSSMQLISLIPVPTMVTRSLTPYTGPDRLSALPMEIMQRVVSNLNANDIRNMRLANRTTCTKNTFDFVKNCLHSLKIDFSKVGFRRGLHNLQIDFASTATKQVTFIQAKDSNGYIANGSRPNTRVNIPSNADIKAVVNNLPNVNTIVIRDTTKQSIVPQALCHALSMAPRTQLGDLTIDGCTMSSKVLISFLKAHSKTLRYLVLRDIRCTDGAFANKLFTALSSGFGLTRLIIDSLYQDKNAVVVGAPQRVLSALRLRCIKFENTCSECGNSQTYTLDGTLASMTGHRGVELGLAKILTRDF